jgi:hypothetical protein
VANEAVYLSLCSHFSHPWLSLCADNMYRSRFVKE